MQRTQLTLTFRILTPLFMGGADPHGQPELRAASIKGVLRFWYRALDPQWSLPLSNNRQTRNLSREMAWFGSTGSGQSPFLLHLIGPPLSRTYPWPERASPGLGYLGYPFRSWQNKPSRQAIAPGQRFTLGIRVIRFANNRHFRRALTASLWCLGHLGALGSRSRRGFGALALEAWTVESGEWPELDELPRLNADPDVTPKTWLARFEQSRTRFQEWFPYADETPETADSTKKRPQPHFGPALRRLLQNRPFPPADWQEVLALMGKRMQDYRSRRSPDYEDVKAYLSRGARLARSPQRCAFGLPLTFRYRSLGGKSVTFQPIDPDSHEVYERHGSLLLLRPVLIGEQLYPFYLRLDGAVPGDEPSAAIKGRHALRPPAVNGMDDFLDWLQRGGR